MIRVRVNCRVCERLSVYKKGFGNCNELNQKGLFLDQIIGVLVLIFCDQHFNCPYPQEHGHYELDLQEE